MKIIKAGYEIMPNFENPLKKIELVARTCYKSEDLITEDSCVKMVDNLVGRKHFAMLEHASLAFDVDAATYNLLMSVIEYVKTLIISWEGKEAANCFLQFTQTAIRVDEGMAKSRFIISGNIRAWLDALKGLEIFGCMPNVLIDGLMNAIPTIMKAAGFDENTVTGVNESYEYTPFEDGFFARQIIDFDELTPEERLMHETLSVKFTVDRGVTHELVRHRPASFAQESTRYCNYSKGKFGNEITIVEPCFFKRPEGDETLSVEQWAERYGAWEYACKTAEECYFRLLDNGATPQEARSVLPTSVKADIIVTANIMEWLHILNLRALGTTGKPHPQMLEVMVPLAKELAFNQLKDFEKTTTIKMIREM